MYNNLQIGYGQSSLQPQVVAGTTPGGEGSGPSIPNGKRFTKHNTIHYYII